MHSSIDIASLDGFKNRNGEPGELYLGGIVAGFADPPDGRCSAVVDYGSPATVKVQVSEVLRKLGASLRSQLIMAQVPHLQPLASADHTSSRFRARAK